LVPVPAEAEQVEPYAPPASSAARAKKPGKSKPQSVATPTQPKGAGATKAEAHASTTKPTALPRTLEREPASSTPAPLPSAPAPIPPTPPAPAPRPVATSKKVVVPRTTHVHVDYPAGLQADLDADPRMQSWVDKVIPIIDGCHSKDRGAKGAIATRVTMHENDRPDADILSLPGQLSSVVACATGSLMRIKMPLFTGREGTRYDVRIVFE
jgi:hypothetical protein